MIEPSGMTGKVMVEVFRSDDLLFRHAWNFYQASTLNMDPLKIAGVTNKGNKGIQGQAKNAWNSPGWRGGGNPCFCPLAI